MHVIFHGTENAAPTHLKVTEEGTEFIFIYHVKSKGI